MRQLARLRSNARVCSEHTRDVGVYLTHVGIECSRKCNCSGIATTATKGGEFTGGRDSLETCNNDDFALGKCSLHAIVFDLENFRLGVHVVGNDAHLIASEADSVDADPSECHGKKCHRNAFAGGEKHVHLATRVFIGHGIGQ